MSPLRAVGDDTPPLDIQPTDESTSTHAYEGGQHEEMPQPASPVLHPQGKPRQQPTAAPVPSRLVTSPSQMTAPAAGGVPWWVWLVVAYALGNRRR